MRERLKKFATERLRFNRPSTLMDLAALAIRQPALAAARLALRIGRLLRLRDGAGSNRADGKNGEDKSSNTKHPVTSNIKEAPKRCESKSTELDVRIKPAAIPRRFSQDIGASAVARVSEVRGTRYSERAWPGRGGLDPDIHRLQSRPPSFRWIAGSSPIGSGAGARQ